VCGDIPSEDDFIRLGRVPAVLHPGLVLIGEEVGEPVVGLGLAEHVPGGDGALMQGGVPVLDAEVATVEGVPRIGDISCREHALNAGLKMLVDDDPVVDAKTPGLEEAGARCYPYADYDELGLDRGAVRRDDALYRALTLKALDRRLGQELDPTAAVQVEVGPSHRRAKHALQG
jgi:hypothetical protein